MSTILKALRRLEEDSSTSTASPADAPPAPDSRAVDELRDRILVEESAAQAGAATDRDSNRTKRIVMFAAAALLILGLGVGAYTMSTRVGSDPTAIVVAETPSPVTAPELEEPRAGEALAKLVALQPTSEEAVVSPIPGAPVPSSAATLRRHSRPETLADSEASDVPSEEALSESQPSTVSAPMPVAVAVPVHSINTSPKPSVVSRSTTTQAPARSAATKSIAASAPTPRKASDEMALASVSPTPATLTASSPRPLATPETALAEPLAEPLAIAIAKATTPRSRPRPTSTAQSPPSVSAPQPNPVPETKSAGSQPYPEPSRVKRLDRPDLPDLTVVRTAWHPDADRRSAKIRLEATDEILTLREGDAIGGLVIQKISPSAVLFKVGDVEVRRRVGHPGSGG